MPTYTQGGRFGAVNGVVALSKWGVNQTSSPVVYRNSATGRLPGRSHAPSSWSGTMSIDGCSPAAMPADIIAFSGYGYPNSGVAGTVGLLHSGNAIIDSLNMSFDYKTNKPVSYTLAFSGANALTISDVGVAIPVTGNYVPFEMCGNPILFRESTETTAAVAIDSVTTATLNITASNGKVTNSSTGCRIDTKPGVADINLSIAVETGNRQLTIGNLYEITIPSAPNSWIIKWVRLKAFTNLTVDISTGAIVGQTMEFEFSRVLNAGTATLGSVTLPSGVAWAI